MRQENQQSFIERHFVLVLILILYAICFSLDYFWRSYFATH